MRTSQEKGNSKGTPYHHGNLRDHLIDASRTLIASQGAEHFKVADACRHAGVSTAAPYRHFSDRQALLDAVAVSCFNNLRDQILSAGEPYRRGSNEAVSAIGKAYVKFACQQSNLFRLMFGQSASEPSDAKKKQTSNEMNECELAGRACYEVLLDQLAGTLGRNDIDEQVVEAAFPLWTFVHGLAFLLIDGTLSVNQMEIDIETQIERATARLMPEANSLG